MSRSAAQTLLLGSFLIAGIVAASATLPSARADSGGVASLSGNAWKIAPQAEVAASGEQISTPGYEDGAWVGAQVPGTVFGSYVRAGLEKEPTYGDNIT